MPRIRRGLVRRSSRRVAAAAGAAICLLIPIHGHAVETVDRTSGREATRRAPSSAAISTIRPQGAALAGTQAPVVTTVSVPGGLSPLMRSVLHSPEALFTPASRDVVVSRRPDGTRIRSSASRFLNVLVLAADAEGGSSMRCVSTLDDAVREAREHRVPAAGAEKE